MAVAVRSVSWVPTTGTGDVDSASISCPKPAGTAAGDFLLAFASRSQTSASITSLTSADWTVAAFFPGATEGNQVPTAVLWKVAGASEPTSYTFTASASANDQFSVHILALTGVDTANPLYAAPTTQLTTTTSATATAPSVTMDGPGLLATWHGLVHYITTATTFSTPTGMTVRVNADGDTGIWLQAATFTENRSAGATGTRAATYSSTSEGVARGISVGIREAASAGAAITVRPARTATAATRPALTQVHALAVRAARAASRATTPALAQDHGTLTVRSARSATTASRPLLAQVHELAVRSARSTSAATRPALGQVHQLVVRSARSSSSATRALLSATDALIIRPARAATRATRPLLTQTSNLLVRSARSVTRATRPALSDEVLGGPADGPTQLTATERRGDVLLDVPGPVSVDAPTRASTVTAQGRSGSVVTDEAFGTVLDMT